MYYVFSYRLDKISLWYLIKLHSSHVFNDGRTPALESGHDTINAQ
jgi:hypothetical protein